MDYQVFAAAAGIALVDIVLSGDNALVIGAAAGRLPRGQRMFAIIWGGVAALVLRSCSPSPPPSCCRCPTCASSAA